MRVEPWRRLSTEELMPLNCGAGKDSWESLDSQAGRSNQSILKEINSEYSVEGQMLKLKFFSILATWCKELTHCKRPWCWESWRAGEEEGDQRWDGWLASPTQWTWVWTNSWRQWRTGKPGVLQTMGLQSHTQRGHWPTRISNRLFLPVSSDNFPAVSDRCLTKQLGVLHVFFHLILRINP